MKRTTVLSEWSKRMVIVRQVLRWLSLLLAITLYLWVFILLFADSVSWLWLLFIVLCHVYYSVALVWLYAYAKVRGKLLFRLLLFPLALTTSLLGIVLWVTWHPDRRVEKWMVKRSR